MASYLVYSSLLFNSYVIYIYIFIFIIYYAIGKRILEVTRFFAKISIKNPVSLALFSGLGFIETSYAAVFQEKTMELPSDSPYFPDRELKFSLYKI
jgi:hypothetical protein